MFQFINTKCTNTGEEVAAELAVQLRDELLVGRGCDRNRKAAKAQAAACLLKDLEVSWYTLFIVAFSSISLSSYIC